MSTAEEVTDRMCEAYAAAVSGNDSQAYGALFEPDAIRMPPGAEPEYGRDAIRASEQTDYDVADWKIQSTSREALQLTDDWIYTIADIDSSTTAHSGGTTSTFKATKTWLLHRSQSGDWRIARQMWNIKSRSTT
jgi:uncharacterized protein (TIGR02246 family)